MDARHLLARHGEHAERVVVAQVGLGGERELGEVGQLAAVVGVHAGRVERRAVVRDVVVGVPQRPPQPLELQRRQLVARRGLDRLEVARRAGSGPARPHLTSRFMEVRHHDAPSSGDGGRGDEQSLERGDGRAPRQAMPHASTAWPPDGHDVHGEAALCATLVAPGGSRPRRGLRHRSGGDPARGARLRLRRRRPRRVDARRGPVSCTAAHLGGGRPRRRRPARRRAASRSTSSWRRATSCRSWPPAAEPQVVARLAAHLADGGLLVAGFGLDRAHLPPAAGLVSLDDYDAWCAAAGLRLVRRFATWAGDDVRRRWLRSEHPRASQ